MKTLRNMVAGVLFLLLALGCETQGGATRSTLVIPRGGKDQPAEVNEAPRISEDPGALASNPIPEGSSLEGPPKKREAPKPEEIEERLASIRRVVREQDYERALEMVNDLRGHSLPEQTSRELDVIRIEVKQHLLQSMAADAFIVADRSRVAVGDVISGEFLLVNLGRERMVIPATVRPSRDRESRSTIHIDVAYVEYALDGSIINERLTWSVEIGDDVDLEPGARRSWPLNLESAHFSPQSVNYRTFLVTASLFPAEIRIGNESYPGTLKFKPARIEVFPRNFEHLEKAPISRLREALKKDSAPHVPIASALVPIEGRREATQTLIDALDSSLAAEISSETRLACCVGLRILTGEDVEPDPERWLAWARANQPRKE